MPSIWETTRLTLVTATAGITSRWMPRPTPVGIGRRQTHEEEHEAIGAKDGESPAKQATALDDERRMEGI